MPDEKDSEVTSDDLFANDVPTATSSRPDLPAQAVPIIIEKDALTASVHFDIHYATAALVEDGRRVIPTVNSFAALSDIFSGLTPEKLAPGYEKMINVLRNFNILTEGGEAKEGDAHPPTFEQVMQSLSAGDLEFANTFHKPILLLIPDMPFNVIVSAIKQATAAHKAGDIKDISVHPSLFKSGRSGNKIKSWGASIVEGAHEIDTDSASGEIYLTLGKRLESRLTHHDPADMGMNLQKYAMLLMATANSGGIDFKRITLIERDPLLKQGEVIQAFRTPDGRINLNLKAANEEPLMRVPFRSHFRSSIDGVLKEDEKGGGEVAKK